MYVQNNRGPQAQIEWFSAQRLAGIGIGSVAQVARKRPAGRPALCGAEGGIFIPLTMERDPMVAFGACRKPQAPRADIDEPNRFHASHG